MMDNHNVEVLLLAHQLEKALAELYAVFIERYTTYRSLWTHLLHEEQGHAEVLRKLYQLTYEKKSFFDAGAIKPAAIQTVIDHVKELSDSAARGLMSETQALKVTHDLESSIFEKDLFTHFKVAAEYGDLLKQVIEEDRAHIQMVKKALQTHPG